MKPKPVKQTPQGLASRKRIVEICADVIKRKRLLPSKVELLSAGVSRNIFEKNFKRMELLFEEVEEAFPKLFDEVITEELFTLKQHETLKRLVKKHKTFFITTAVAGSLAHEGFLQSIETFCKKKKALHLILPAEDPGSASNFNLDSILPKANLVGRELKLNSNFFLNPIKLSARHIDPVAGLTRIAQKRGSFVFASPKQRLKFIPVSNQKHPHALMTTGAVTLPNYKAKGYRNERLSSVSKLDHVVGGIIVEIKDNKKFNFRQVQANEKGHFVDLAEFYCGKKIKKLYAEALFTGDFHSGETDIKALAATTQLCDVVRPRKIFLNDLFNGLSINHHEEHRLVRLAILHERGLSRLEDELRQVSEDLDLISLWPWVEEVFVLESNHDKFLDRWVEKGGYVRDKENFRVGHELAKAMLDGKDPLQYSTELFEMKSKKVKWLTRNDDYFIAGIQCANHGDLGPNGSRGSIAAMEKAYGKSNSAHRHAAEILRDAWQAPTLSILKPDYAKGASDWTHGNIVQYPNGMRQLVLIFDGEW